MIPLQIKLKSYDKLRNEFKATTLQNGNTITLDPFVNCAIELSDDDYELDKGFYFVGRVFIMTAYLVRHDCVIALESGLIDITCDSDA